MGTALITPSTDKTPEAQRGLENLPSPTEAGGAWSLALPTLEKPGAATSTLTLELKCFSATALVSFFLLLFSWKNF